MINLKRLNKTESEIIACLRSTDSFYVSKNTRTSGERLANAAAKFEEAGYITEFDTGSHHSSRRYRSTSKLWSDLGSLGVFSKAESK